MQTLTKLLAATAIGLTAVSGAQAGGFQRGIADTDILFESGPYSTRAGVTYINPRRGFESINGVSGDYDTYTGDYVIPSYAFKFGGDQFACAGHFTESFAAEANYDGAPGGALPSFSEPGSTASSRTRSIEFKSNEFGATCRVSYTAEIGRFSLLGGVYFEDFDFDGSSFGERNLTGAFAGTPLAGAGLLLAGTGSQLILPTEVDVNSNGGYETGYRIGVAYERPEIALRVQGLYRSEVKHDSINGGGTVSIDSAFVRLANGTQVSVPTFFSNPAFGLSAGQQGAIVGGIGQAAPAPGSVIPVESSLSTAISPQSFTLSGQTGIAPGTLLLASLRWTDWSTNGTVVSTISSPITGTSSTIQPYNWRDGWTANVGLGRAFNETVSGAISFGYDRGDSTGSDTTYTDLYTVTGGVSLKRGFAELRVGGVVGYWTDGEQSIDDGAYFDATVGDDWVYGASASLKLSF
jgi:long-chain fatty acid transport protein